MFVVPSERAAADAENEKSAAVFLGRPGRDGRPIAIDVVNGSHFYPSPQLLSPEISDPAGEGTAHFWRGTTFCIEKQW